MMKLGLPLLAACALMQVLCAGGSTAFAAESHAFDPVLSLTGSCEVSELDPKPDPGLCPIPPGVAGVDHPKLPFRAPHAVATDSFGNIYVSNVESTRGVIDIFDASGNFLSELEDPEGPQALAIDSKGNLYVGHLSEKNPEFGVVLYKPTVYKPTEGQIEYGTPPKGVVGESGEEGASAYGLAVDPLNDQLFVKVSNSVMLFKSATEENGFIEKFETGLGAVTGEPLGVDVDAARGHIVMGTNKTPGGVIIRVLDLASPHGFVCAISGSAVPDGKFIASTLSIAVDEGTGHIFAYDGEAKKVYEFDSDCAYLSTIERGFQPVFRAQITVDNGKDSPNGEGNPFGHYLYVPSNQSGTGHSYAFGPSNLGSPIIESVSFGNVGEREAELRAEIEPFGLPTHYTFEYVSRQQFEESGGFTGAQVAGEGEIPASNFPVSVAVGAAGLQPETAYRFRVVAVNEEGADEGEGEFATFPAAQAVLPCPNDPLRVGFSALLPDCRAYELVTPPSTNARTPTGVNGNLGVFFASRETSPAGDAVSFEIFGGSLPGSEAVGSLAGDPYLAHRTAGGWTTSYVGPNGLEAPSILPGSHSPDQGYSFWQSNDDDGSAQVDGENTTYVRYPDGHSALVGRGSIADDPHAQGKLISENGSHILFVSTNALEPNAPPDGTQTIYDRTSDEVTHVVSLLPEDQTPGAGQNAFREGLSLDGKGVAFRIGNGAAEGPLFLRYNNEETYEVGDGSVTFEGVAEGGSLVFYLEGGDLFSYDVGAGTRTVFTETGNVTPVNVSANGAVAYFVSPSVISGTKNPRGDKPVKGGENLYRSEEGAVSFVGTVTERDVVGGTENVKTGGLGLWARAQHSGELAIDPSRTAVSGDVLLFESRAPLATYDSEGHVEIYRYDFAADALSCLSCNPTLAPAGGDASLQSVLQGVPALGAKDPLSSYSNTANLSPDGHRAFFQSTDALVPADTDGLQDVYEWEGQGVGSCIRQEGCVSLVSSGHSARIDYLFAVSESGDDVFFRTSDLLLPSDLEETPSIYDARLNGGFAEEPQPPVSTTPLSPQPDLPAPGMLPSEKSGNVKPPKQCPKGKKKVRRHGKVVCAKKKHHKHHHRTAGKNKRGGHK